MQNLAAFMRDTQLTPGLLEKYKPGTIFRERGFTDTSDQFGGFAASHRFLILTGGSSVRKLGALSANPEWNLCVFKPGCSFKVIGVDKNEEHTQITLFEFPIEDLPNHRSNELNEAEQNLAKRATQWFEEALRRKPLPELTDPKWLRRTELPLGIGEDGEFFEALSRTDEADISDKG